MSSDHFKKLVSDMKAERKGLPIDATSGTGGKNARYGFVKLVEGSKISDHTNENAWTWACHSRVMQGKRNIFALWSLWLPHPSVDKKISDTYFNWLTGSKSPWRTVLDHQKPIVVDGDNLMSSEFMYDYGFSFYELDTLPSNYMMNFLVATRMCHEWPELIKIWYKLVTEHGVDESVAFSHLTLWYGLELGQSSCILHTNDKYDWPLDITGYDDKYLDRFVNGKMQNGNKPFIGSQGVYTPVNKVWGNSVGTNRYKDFIYKTYGKDFGIGLSQAVWQVPFKDIVSIMKIEQDRVYSAIAS